MLDGNDCLHHLSPYWRMLESTFKSKLLQQGKPALRAEDLVPVGLGFEAVTGLLPLAFEPILQLEDRGVAAPQTGEGGSSHLWFAVVGRFEDVRLAG